MVIEIWTADEFEWPDVILHARFLGYNLIVLKQLFHSISSSYLIDFHIPNMLYNYC